ncbi:MAG: Efflux transporter periplasmic adaptor subunit [Candidatus Poribacteria bacterium]|nr:Efflux transporter periplasmic adaptor subunit [Candidatus Poribacteria bacterium]
MKRLIIIIIVVVLVIGVGGGIYLARGKIFTKKKSNTSMLQTVTVRRGDITTTVSATGTIQPLITIEVRSKASGAITKLYVDEGDTVKAGDLMAEIEKTYTQIDVDQAKADLRSAQARLQQADMNIELQTKQSESQINQAQENVTSAKAKLAQLEEQIKYEHITNARAVKDAQNDIDISKLRLSLAQNPRPETVKKAQLAIDQAKSNMELAKAEYDRRQALYDKQFVSKSELDSAKSSYDSSKTQYESALEQLKLAKDPSSEDDIKLAQKSIDKAESALAATNQKVDQEKLREKDLQITKLQVKDAENSLALAIANKAQIELKKKDKESAQASLVRSQATLKSANDKNDDTIVRAPSSGTILARNVVEGQVISSSLGALASAGTLLFTMADLDNVYVQTDVDETDMGKLKVGQPVTITVDAYPDRKFQGKVLKIAPMGKAVQNVTTFKVTTVIENPSKILKPGMNASVEITAESVSNVLVVENEAIMDTKNGKTVTPVIDGKPGNPMPVEVGVRGWDTSEIIFGVEEGDVLMLASSASGKAGQQGLPAFMKNPSATFGQMQRQAQQKNVSGGGGPGGPPPGP